MKKIGMIVAVEMKAVLEGTDPMRRRNIQAIGFWSMRRRTVSFMH